MSVRKPKVAGSFYSASSEDLRAQIEECFLHSLGPGKLPKVDYKGEKKVVGLVSPHAGYVYSGPAAAYGFYHLSQDTSPELVVILGPNHTGLGAPVAVGAEDSWETPLGLVSVDTRLCTKIAKNLDLAKQDKLAHSQEHSIEVQIPFLQYIYGSSFRIVPICVLDQGLNTCIILGEAIAQIISGADAVVIASTDFTHYELQEQAEKKDKQAIDAILNLEPNRLASVVQELNISMCGVGPVVAMLTTAKRLGAKQAQLLSYHTSGDVTGDRLAVVGYGSVKVTRR